jgi:hypothetical protein
MVGLVLSVVFNATFNNISGISWLSVFIGGSNWSTGINSSTFRKSLTFLSHDVVSTTPRHFH